MYLCLVCHLIGIRLLNLIYQFANKEGNKTVEGIFFVTNVIMTKNFLKLIYDFIIGRKITQILFA